MKTLKKFINTEANHWQKEFSILQNEKGEYTLDIDGDTSNDVSSDFWFHTPEELERFAKRNVKNLNEDLQNEILTYISNL